MQGWTPDFIPKLTEDAIRENRIDRVLAIPAPEALKGSAELERMARGTKYVPESLLDAATWERVRHMCGAR